MTRRTTGWAVAGVLVVAALAAVLAVLKESEGAPEAVEREPQPAGTLPQAPDYHSLLVAGDGAHLLLGTHNGVFESRDGGRTWRHAGLQGRDAMNLARGERGAVWVAGHEVLARSADDGRTWRNVRPRGLPGLDIHAFAIDPRDPRRLYAAVAREGLFRSDDGGRSFQQVSTLVGGSTYALAVTASGRILASGPRQGVLMSRDGGKRWAATLKTELLGIAVNPKRPRRIIAATSLGMLLSTDEGRSWRSTQSVSGGAGPVAWASANLAYFVGFDGFLYRSTDGGRTWKAVL